MGLGLRVGVRVGVGARGRVSLAVRRPSSAAAAAQR